MPKLKILVLKLEISLVSNLVITDLLQLTGRSKQVTEKSEARKYY